MPKNVISPLTIDIRAIEFMRHMPGNSAWVSNHKAVLRVKDILSEFLISTLVLY